MASKNGKSIKPKVKKETPRQSAQRRFTDRYTAAVKEGYGFAQGWFEKALRKSTANIEKLRGDVLRREAITFTQNGEQVSPITAINIRKKKTQEKRNLTLAEKKLVKEEARKEAVNETIKINFTQETTPLETAEINKTEKRDFTNELPLDADTHDEDDDYNDDRFYDWLYSLMNDDIRVQNIEAEYDTSINNVRDVFESWKPNQLWSPQFEELKRNDKNIGLSVLDGAISQLGKQAVYNNIEKNSELIHSLAWDICYGDSGDKKDTTTSYKINKFAKLIYNRDLTSEEAKFYSESVGENA